MNAYVIDGANMPDRAAAHAELARALMLPPMVLILLLTIERPRPVPPVLRERPTSMR